MLLIEVLYILLFIFYVNATENVIYIRPTRQTQQYNGVRQTNDIGQTHRKLSSQLGQLAHSRAVGAQKGSPDNLQFHETRPPMSNLTPKFLERNTSLRELGALDIKNEQETIIGDTTTAQQTVFQNIEGARRALDIDFKSEPVTSNSWLTTALPIESPKRNTETMFINKISPELETTNKPNFDEQSSKYSQERSEINSSRTLVAPKLLQEKETADISKFKNAFEGNPAGIGTILVNPDEIQDDTETLFDDNKLKRYKQETSTQNTENLYVYQPPLTTTPSVYSVYYGNNQVFQVGSERVTSIPTTLRPAYKVPAKLQPLISMQPQPRKSFITQPTYLPKSQLMRQLNPEPAINLTSQQPFDQECLREYAYYGIENNCDSFIECKEKHAIKKTCPEGLHFNPKAEWPNYPCSYPSEVQCGVNARIEPPIPTEQCPHQFGFFQSPDGDCNKYIMCQHGRAINMTCASGLVFNMDTETCDWPDNVPTCEPKIFSGFICPQLPAGDNNSYGDTVTMHRYGSSCRKFVACQKGIPRLLSCDPGLAFDEQTEMCVIADNVTNCENDRIVK